MSIWLIGLDLALNFAYVPIWPIGLDLAFAFAFAFERGEAWNNTFNINTNIITPLRV